MKTENEKEGQPTVMRETIDDIADEIRRAVESMGDEMPYTVSAGTLRRVADRIEAAGKREKAMEGNHNEMREALVKAKKAICHHAKYVCQSLSWENSDIQSNCADVLCAHRDLCEAKSAINDALSAPPRNCDVGNAEEQYRRWIHFCEQHLHRCDNCPCNRPEGCTFTFENMPYDAKEGENHE